MTNEELAEAIRRHDWNRDWNDALAVIERMDKHRLALEDAFLALLAERDALRETRSSLWRALAEIVEAQTAAPNATVRRLIGIAEDALIGDQYSIAKPVPRFGKHALAQMEKKDD